LLNLTNLEQLPATGTTLMIGALRLQAAERSPARVLALLPEP
jgi:kynurenine formamidase